MPTPEQLAEIRKLLKDGKPQEADDLIAKLEEEEAAADKTATAKPKEPPPPRKVDAILSDFFHTLVDVHGNHPRLEALMAEFDAATAPPNKV